MLFLAVTPLAKKSAWRVAGGGVVGALAWPKLAPALKLTTRSVNAVPFTETVRATGTLGAKESINLQVEVSGKVTAISFVEGAIVKKGDLPS